MRAVVLSADNEKEGGTSPGRTPQGGNEGGPEPPWAWTKQPKKNVCFPHIHHFSRVFSALPCISAQFPQICRVSGTPRLAYYVDLSQRLWDIKQDLLRENR